MFIEIDTENDSKSNINSDVEPYYTLNLESDTIQNDNYRKVMHTGKNLQLVLMSLQPNDLISMEIHQTHDQFIRIESGNGIATIGSTNYNLTDGTGLIVPAGFAHEIKNTSSLEPLKLYTIYSPPEHPDKLVQKLNPNITNKEEIKKKHISNNENDDEKLYKLKYLKYKSKYEKLKNQS